MHYHVKSNSNPQHLHAIHRILFLSSSKLSLVAVPVTLQERGQHDEDRRLSTSTQDQEATCRMSDLVADPTASTKPLTRSQQLVGWLFKGTSTQKGPFVPTAGKDTGSVS